MQSSLISLVELLDISLDPHSIFALPHLTPAQDSFLLVIHTRTYDYYQEMLYYASHRVTRVCTLFRVKRPIYVYTVDQDPRIRCQSTDSSLRIDPSPKSSETCSEPYLAYIPSSTFTIPAYLRPCSSCKS